MNKKWGNILKKEIEMVQSITQLPCLRDKTNNLLTISHKIRENQKHLPLLYRYSAADYWNIRSLEQQKLVLRPANEMNDIFEGDVISSFAVQGTIEKIKSFQKNMYLKSLSENKLDLLMFAHYGDNFKGMCVEYDFTQSCCIENLFPVVYVQKPFESLAPEKLKNNCFFFLRKATPWKYESEWRFIKLVEDEANQDQTQLIDVSGCIKTIYLGPQMEEAKKKHIKEIAEKANNRGCYNDNYNYNNCNRNRTSIQVKELKLSKDSYALEESPSEHLNAQKAD